MSQVIAAAERYMDAVKAVFDINPATKDNYASGSPSNDDETFRRFVALNDTGKALRAAIKAEGGEQA